MSSGGVFEVGTSLLVGSMETREPAVCAVSGLLVVGAGATSEPLIIAWTVMVETEDFSFVAEQSSATGILYPPP